MMSRENNLYFLSPHATETLDKLQGLTATGLKGFTFYCRNLREARDNALEEKERALASEKETASKYDLLQSE